MLLSNIPAKIAAIFAASGTKNTIPLTTAGVANPNNASFDVGFPPITMTPVISGGLPPFGADVNGILNPITAVQQWQSAGGFFQYDAAFSTAIGGYPQGAVLLKGSGTGLWQSTVDNNTTDPDTGGAGWWSISGGRLLNIQVFTASGTYTPTAGAIQAIVEGVGGGGAGGGCAAAGAGNQSVGGGGSAGAWGLKNINSGLTTTTVTIGAAGTGVAGANGNAGGTTSFGALLTLLGGGGGGVGTVVTGAAIGGAIGVQSGAPTGATVGSAGAFGLPGISYAAVVGLSGAGAGTRFGGGGTPVGGNAALAGAGNPATGYGAAGAGAIGIANSATAAGGNGAAGILIIYEYS